MTVAIDFDTPDLARAIERLDWHDIDTLPYGAILIARDGTTRFYSETEKRQSGYPGEPVGQNLFEVAHRFGNDEFRGRIRQAEEAGPVDLEIAWPGDYSDRSRELRVRVQSARPNGLWLFIERDKAPGKHTTPA